MFFKNNCGKLILIFSVFLLLFSFSAVNAESMTTHDFKDLQNEVNNVADGACVVLEGNFTSDGSTCVKIDKDLTIDGKGNTFDGNNQKKSRIISIEDANVNLVNIIFKNTKAGFIKCSGDSHLSIINCTFADISTDDKGAAILNNGEFPLQITNSTFLNNHADDYGGAIYSNKDVIVSGSTFIGNTASKVSLKVFSGYSSECGGAICSKSAVFSYNSIFKNNTAYGNGGAIFSTYSYLGNSTFINNKATAMKGISAYGGAVRSKECMIDLGCIFKDNYSKDCGGAVYTDYVRSDIVGCSFNGNHADDDGGCIYVNKKCDFKIMSSTFDKNFAIAGDGGAVYSDSKSSLITLTNSTFKGNYANGGIQRRFGGAVYSKGPLNIENSIFLDNWAENRGGAIYCDNTITFNSDKASYFIGNIAKKSSGGAIYTSKLNKNIRNVIFSKNKSNAGDGGALYVNDGCTMTFSNCYFSFNFASNRGGAIYTDNSRSTKLSLINNVFYLNKANDQGQSVFNSGYYTNIRGNWWGLNGNNGNNNGGQLYEYHAFKSNEKHVDSQPASLTVSIPQSGFVDTPISIKINHPWNLNNCNYYLDNIVLSSNKNGKFVNKIIDGSNILIHYIPYEKGVHSISVNDCGQKFNGNINVVDSSVVGFDLVKNYQDSTPFVAKFKDINGNLLANGTVVKFIVNGIECNSTILYEGIAKLDINLKPGNYTVKSVNTVTGEYSLNKISVISRISQYYVGDVYSVHLHNNDGVSLSDGTFVDFVVGNRTFSAVVKDSVSSFKLDLLPGKYYVDVICSGNVIYSDYIKVSNRIITPASGFGSYGNLKPIINEVVVPIGGGKLRSDLGNNYYRIIDFASNTNIIMYNITVEDTASLVKLFKSISENTVKADLFNINLHKKVYLINENDATWEDSDYKYLLNVHYGKVIINGNGATITNKYNSEHMFNDNHIFALVSKNSNLHLHKLTISNFAEVYKNMGNILSNSTVFSENNAKTRLGQHKIYNAAVIENFGTAFFIDCIFNDNKPETHLLSHDDAGVLYANKNSLTYFVNCDFKSNTDTICAFEGSNINFYTSNPTLPKGYYESESCVSFKPLSSWYNTKSNVGVFNCTTVGELTNALKYVNGYNNYSSIVINLKNIKYTLNKEYLESLARADYHNQEGGLADRHYFCFEVGSTPVTINGNGATINTKGVESGDDYHFCLLSRFGSLSLNNVTIKGFNSPIRNFGTGKLVKVTFDSNVYTHITATFGGAIYNNGVMHCINCTFNNNIARNGGAIYSCGPLLQIVGGSFKNNKVTLSFFNPVEDIRVVGTGVVKLVGVNPVVERKDDALVLKRTSAKTIVGEFNINSVSDLMNVREIVNAKECAFDIINMNFNPKVYNCIFHRDDVLFDVKYGNVIINGNGCSIGVKNPELSDEIRFLKVGKIASVVLNNFKISGFNTAILNDGALNIYNCLFSGNKVSYMVKDDYAGAIHNNGYCNIHSSKFVDNYGKYGGALYNKGYCDIYNSTFLNNVGYNTHKNVDVYNFEGICNVAGLKGSIINIKNDFRMSMFARDALHAGCHVAVTLVSYGVGYAVNSFLLNAAIKAGSLVSTATLASYGSAAKVAGTVFGTGVGTIFTLSEATIDHDFSGVGMAILNHISTAYDNAEDGVNFANVKYNNYIKIVTKQEQIREIPDSLIEIIRKHSG